MQSDVGNRIVIPHGNFKFFSTNLFPISKNHNLTGRKIMKIIWDSSPLESDSKNWLCPPFIDFPVGNINHGSWLQSGALHKDLAFHHLFFIYLFICFFFESWKASIFVLSQNVHLQTSSAYINCCRASLSYI